MPKLAIACSSAAYCRGRSSRWRTIARRQRFVSTGLASGSGIVTAPARGQARPGRPRCAPPVSATRPSQARLPAAKSWPQPSAVDQHPPVGDHVGEERRLALCVLEADHIDAPSCRRRELGAQLDDPLQVWITKSHEHVDVASGSRSTSGHRSEQQGEADVVLGAQRCPQSREQLPRAPHVLPLGQRDVQRPRRWPSRTKAAFRDRAAKRAFMHTYLTSQEGQVRHESIIDQACVRSSHSHMSNRDCRLPPAS